MSLPDCLHLLGEQCLACHPNVDRGPGPYTHCDCYFVLEAELCPEGWR